MRTLHLIAFAVAGVFGSAAQAGTISYPGTGGVLTGWGPWSGPQFAGEAFTAPGATLDDFTLYVAGTGCGASCEFNFVAQVYAFNGSTVGPALYTSTLQTTGQSAGGYFNTYTFDPDIALTQGNRYIALVTDTLNGTFLGGGGYGYIETGRGGTGSLYYGSVGGNIFAPYSGGYDAAFNADFGPAATAVPEPGSLALMGVGLVGLVAYRIRRRATFPVTSNAPPSLG